MEVIQHAKIKLFLPEALPGKKQIFKNLSIFFVFFTALLSPTLCQAWCWWRACDEPNMESCCPDDYYAGLGYKHLWAKPRPNWRPILRKTHPEFLGYFGWRFFPAWAVEVGYEWSTAKPQAVDLVTGSRLLQVTNNTGTNAIVTGKVRFKTGYLDLNYFWQIPWFEDCFVSEVILSLGVSSTRAKIDVDVEPDSIRTTEFGLLFLDADSKARTLLRVGAGFQIMLTDILGFRGMWRFENTNALRAKRGVGNILGNEKIFRNSQSVALSLFLTFKAF